MAVRQSIEIVPYKDTWPVEFQTIGRELRRALGDLELRIDHIGSTAVPGLAAKDIIDIQITVQNLDAMIETALTRAGYQRVERITHDHIPPGGPDSPDEWVKWFFRPPVGQRPTNLHVRITGRANQRYPLLFRDYLRASPDAADAYSRVKTALARYHADDIEAYLAVKDPVCDVIMDGAEMWAEKSGWKPGNSDC